MRVDLRKEHGGAWECGRILVSMGADARGERRAEICAGTFVN